VNIRIDATTSQHGNQVQLVIDASALRIVFLTLTHWLDRRERATLAYLIEENLVLRRHNR
jgi:hypothetical protein